MWCKVCISLCSDIALRFPIKIKLQRGFISIKEEKWSIYKLANLPGVLLDVKINNNSQVEKQLNYCCCLVCSQSSRSRHMLWRQSGFCLRFLFSQKGKLEVCQPHVHTCFIFTTCTRVAGQKLDKDETQLKEDCKPYTLWHFLRQRTRKKPKQVKSQEEIAVRRQSKPVQKTGIETRPDVVIRMTKILYIAVDKI